MGKWKCDTDTCDWTGDYPDITPSYKFLGTEESETVEEYIETCPVCGTKTLAIHNFNNAENQRMFFATLNKIRG